MNLNELNQLLTKLRQNPNRDDLFALAFGLVRYMGLDMPKEGREKLTERRLEGLRPYLVMHPVFNQPQYYRMNEKDGNILIYMGVLDKVDKKRLVQFVDKEQILSFQGTPEVLKDRPKAAPYLLHFVATAKYDQLHLVLHQGDQKRILTFRNRLSQTQFQKILPQWEGIGTKSKREIQKTLWNSLDLKEVNKDFYKLIKDRFDALLTIAKTQAPDAKEEDVKQFAVRLIGRYIFCWFLKEKGVIPEPLLASETIGRFRDEFFQKYLVKLFFETLNAETSETTVRERTETSLDSLFGNIPYLNGGLFDEHPEDYLFKFLNLNDWLLSFVRILEQFDFTVDESSSLYQLVAIDPEMLGRIFENLLASQNKETEKLANDRKAFGAFYTPREIVDYMVNESLKAYLESQLLPAMPQDLLAAEPETAYGDLPLFAQNTPMPKAPRPSPKSYEADIERKREKLQKQIDKLFSPDCGYNPFDKEDTPAVREALGSVKVLDPACGSGAFPMGVLLRLMELRQVVGHGHRSNYDLKGEILSRNIYGVDIMPMAVEIARLRAWLSLVLEADYKPQDRKNNFGIAALPNLDFKFVCANSLVDIPEEEYVANQSAVEIENFKLLTSRYFNTAHEDKKRLKKEIQTSISRLIEVHVSAVKEFEVRLEKGKSDLTSSQKKQRQERLDEHKQQVNLWESFENIFRNKTVGFFAPKYFFPAAGDGFDVVIGNPPYVQIQGMKVEEKKILAAQNYETFEPTGDLYQLFYERSVQVLKSRTGILSFITSNKWMRTNYGSGTRRFLGKDTEIFRLVDFGMTQIFESATTYTNILLAKKRMGGVEIPMCRIREDFKNSAGLKEYVDGRTLLIDNPLENTWVAYSKEEYSVVQKVEQMGVELRNWEIKINRGILTGLNEAFIISKEIRERLISEDPKSEEIIRPILRGEDVRAYIPAFQDHYLIATFPALKINIDHYPAVRAHLERFRVQLEPKPKDFNGEKWKGRKSGSYRWFETQDSIGYYQDFANPKIIYPNMTKFLPFAYDETGLVTNQKCFILSGERLKYLLGVFNSTLWKFCFRNRFPELLGETYELSKVFFDKIPIKVPDPKEEAEMERLVNQILAAKKLNPKADTTDLERQIDVLVYRLYGLTYEEVKVVDPGFWLREGEYENVKSDEK